MPKILTRLRIDEVSAVDRGAGEGVKIVLMKRADAEPRRSYEKFLKIFTSKAEADGGGGDITNHPVVQAARLLVASGKFGDHGQALDYLLNKPAGQALLTRLKAADKPAKESTMDSIHSIMKDAGIASVCAQIVQKGSTTISEQEIVEAVTKIAAERHPGLTEAQAFAKVYTDQGAEGRSLRDAINVAKAMPFVADSTQLMVGGVDAMREANDATEQSKADAQLQQIGRDKWPTASEAQQFARAMTDPKNAVLAAKAHRRPSPTTSFEFPR
jgi:hypothetical protein